MTTRTLHEHLRRLTVQDGLVLDDLERFRLLTSRQIEQMHFADNRSQLAAIRATNRALNRLRYLGVVGTLERRIGGVRSGSAGLVWHLTSAGYRLQQLRRGEVRRRRRPSEPSRHFVRHTMAIAEAAVQIVQAARAGEFELLRLETEPDNWQASLTTTGLATWLKPDLLVVTASGDFEQHWFIEVDLDTEHLPVIRRQRDAYLQHRSSGRYQAEHGVYPAVLWLAPSDRRVAAIRAAMAKDTAKVFQTIRGSDLVRHIGDHQ